MKKAEFVPDDTQREVIEATGGDHLVLASPGCGKTQILSERIRRAHHQGVPFDQMLCLTFTNRAARGMFERIHDTVDDHQVDDVFVGNVHRFCSRFLFTNELVPGDSSIIDDEESVSIIARFMQEDEDRVNHDFHRKRYYSQVMQLSHLIHQVVNGHSRDVRMHAEVLEKDDIRSLRIICQAQGMQFSALALDDIYRHTDFYQGLLDGEAYRDADGRQLRLTLRKLQLAYQYEKYKTDHHLLDFEDLLILTFDILNNDELHQYPRYGWIQVDEVQDLNPLQMRIIDLLTDQDATVVYLGDDQQAIFSFMGAKMENIELLKDRCRGHIHHLGINHRSPYYLLRVFNDYAQKVLDISPELLPAPADLNAGQGNELKISHSKNLEQELDTKVMDRTMVILDIFAKHATTREGKLQVELAQLKYRSNRLIGMGQVLSRLGGGIGTRGPGEKKLEVDRRIIRERIAKLSSDLKDDIAHREVMRKQRLNSHIPIVSIVGYTNAGKSTLLNHMTQAGVLEEDKLFATLDPTSRNYKLPNGQEIILTDTVGFIRKLPHHLIDAFRSTLEEAKFADIILHVVDISNPQADLHILTVYDTLRELGVKDKPVVTLFNKIDKVDELPAVKDFQADHTLYISAKQETGFEKITDILAEIINQSRIYIEQTIPYAKAGVIQQIRKSGNLLEEEYREDGIFVRAYVDAGTKGLL